jgi:dihydroorotate dehydrogenase electron transfer subunit
LHILCGDRILRRPFSIHRIREKGVEVLFKIKGAGTEWLSKRSAGDILDIAGPCGKGFKIEDKKCVLIGGGIGIAPLLSLAESLKEKPIILIGAKNRDEILCVKDFEAIGADVAIATEDGSFGYRGYVTELLSEKYPIYACGPRAMLKKIAEFAKKNGVSCQVLVEERFGCGVGACMCCAVLTKKGYKRVCADGPVFSAEELLWE